MDALHMFDLACKTSETKEVSQHLLIGNAVKTLDWKIWIGSPTKRVCFDYSRNLCLKSDYLQIALLAILRNRSDQLIEMFTQRCACSYSPALLKLPISQRMMLSRKFIRSDDQIT
jgi:hypothetical protein